MKRESFKGLMFTLRVAKARNSPATKTNPLHTKRHDNHISEILEVHTPTMAGKLLSYCIKTYPII